MASGRNCASGTATKRIGDSDSRPASNRWCACGWGGFKEKPLRELNLFENACNRTNDLAHFQQSFVLNFTNQNCVPHPPIYAAHMLAKNGAIHRQSRGKQNLGGIPLDFARYWTNKGNGSSEIKAPWRQNQGRSAACLFASRLWVEIQPNQVA